MRATTSVYRLRFAVAAALMLGIMPNARGDSAPDWLRTAAQEKTPADVKNAVAVVLLDDQVITIKDKGDVEVRLRRAYRILRPEARDTEYAVAHVEFSNDTKISYFKAWTIMPNGHEIEVKEKDAVEVGISSFEVYSDLRTKAIKFPEANPGSVVGFESVQKQRPYVFEDAWYFQKAVPVRRSRLVLQLPPGWEFRTIWANHPEQKPETIGVNQYAWEVTDSPAVEIEPAMPPWNAVAGHMGIKYYPRDPAMRSRTTGTWKDIGLWYNELTASTRTISPGIQQKASELTAGLTDPIAKMKALAEFTQRQIRYAAIEVGIGGVLPHPAPDVFVHRYGDCKDKATLLSAMLHVIGIESYYVSIDTERGLVQPDFPSMQFDHVILAIRLPESVPDNVLYAVVKDPELGLLLFFDPTEEYVPLGYLPWELQNNYGLVFGPKGGELMKLPLLPAPTNRLLRTGTVTLTASGKLDGAFQEVSWGGPAQDKRAQMLLAPPAQRRKVIESFLGNSLSDFTLTKASVGNLELYDQSLTLEYRVVADSYAKAAGNLLILRPRVVGSKQWSILSGKPRKYPIEFPEATRQDDVFDITLPDGYVVDELPKPVNVECPYGSYKSQVQMSGNTLHYTRTYEIKDVYVPTEKLDEVKGFLNQIAADERASAVLRRAN
ncbi:MAG TPA: DUF3857 domain-containing protein [Candidatus Sulfotelmatobacter sp.]|nr:DUF3857 domain-containing protein [Candidatus Sulfotelmatobacter sp.]